MPTMQKYPAIYPAFAVYRSKMLSRGDRATKSVDSGVIRYLGLGPRASVAQVLLLIPFETYSKGPRICRLNQQQLEPSRRC